MQQRFQNLKDRILQMVSSEDNDLKANIRSLVALLAVVAILLPWLPLGPDQSKNGAQLLSYSMLSSEKMGWLTSNPLGAVLFFLHQPVMIFLVFLVFFKTIKGHQTTVAHVILIALPPLTIMASGVTILDKSTWNLLFIPMPLWGLSLLMLCQLGLLIQSIYEMTQDPKANKEETNGPHYQY